MICALTEIPLGGRFLIGSIDMYIYDIDRPGSATPKPMEGIVVATLIPARDSRKGHSQLVSLPNWPHNNIPRQTLGHHTHNTCDIAAGMHPNDSGIYIWLSEYRVENLGNRRAFAKLNPLCFPVPHITASDVAIGDTISYKHMEYIEVDDIDEDESGEDAVVALHGTMYLNEGVCTDVLRLKPTDKVLLLKRGATQ